MVKKLLLSILVTFMFVLLSIIPLITIEEIIKTRVPNQIIGFSVHTYSWDDGYFEAEGTWKMDYSSKNDYYLPNKSIIKCDKESGYCTEASVVMPGPKRGMPVFLSLREHVIEKWDNRNIIYIENIGLGGEYGRRIVTIDRETKNVTAAYKKLKNVPKNNPFILDTDPMQRDCLVDGYDICKKLKEDAFPAILAWCFGMIYLLSYFYCIRKVWKKKY